MKQADEVLADILNSVPQPIWVVGPAGEILYTNPAALTTLGYDECADLRGRSSHETLHPYRPDGSPYPPSECPMLKPALTGAAVRGDSEFFLRRDGSFISAYWWSSPIDLPIGRGAIYSFVDMTERLAHEQAARERELARVRAAEFQATRRRLVESADAIHRQTARDLHDGAQQRLVNLMICLQLARTELNDAPAATLDLLSQALHEAQGAIDDLRSLAAGIHPTVLTTRGLAAAVRALAARCAIPTEVRARSVGRLPSALESNAYFLVAEALTNATKHSHATRITITIDLTDALEVRVCDDGIGGIPDSHPGSGLIGLHDRVRAFNGRLLIHSPPGQGTTIFAWIPVPDESAR
ncbi:PAS domain S-box protein [Actinocorallia aurea]